MTPDRYLELQFKKGIHHGLIHNAELNPTPSGSGMAKLEGKESSLVLEYLSG